MRNLELECVDKYVDPYDEHVILVVRVYCRKS